MFIFFLKEQKNKNIETLSNNYIYGLVIKKSLSDFFFTFFNFIKKKTIIKFYKNHYKYFQILLLELQDFFQTILMAFMLMAH